ncbi:MAG: hypothetical protein M1817_004599 [Caeruleum heppii]|nr:MAG: hypothetical protein M1817_004599 [Caeruleum heppii]
MSRLGFKEAFRPRQGGGVNASHKVRLRRDANHESRYGDGGPGRRSRNHSSAAEISTSRPEPSGAFELLHLALDGAPSAHGPGHIPRTPRPESTKGTELWPNLVSDDRYHEALFVARARQYGKLRLPERRHGAINDVDGPSRRVEGRRKRDTSYTAEELFRRASDAQELNHIVSSMTQTSEGRCELRTTHSQGILALNAITNTLRRHHIALGRGLCNLGLEVSLRRSAGAAIRSYLEELRQRPEKVTNDEFRRLVLSVLRSVDSSRLDPIRFGAWQKRDALELLTGWRTAGIGGDREERSPSLAFLLSRDEPGMVELYLEALKKLGGAEAIWADWLEMRRWREGREGSEDEIDPSQPDWKRTIAAYVKACVAAKSVDRACELLAAEGPAFRPQLAVLEAVRSGRIQNEWSFRDWLERDKRSAWDLQMAVVAFENALGVWYFQKGPRKGTHKRIRYYYRSLRTGRPRRR